MSDLKLERMLLGELPVEESEKARLEELRRENEEILAKHPPNLVKAEIDRRASELRQPRRWPVIMMAAAAAALVLWSVQPEKEETRWKGGPHLVIHRNAGDHADRLSDGAAVKAGDVLQVSYVAMGKPYGVILSIDGGGVVTLHRAGELEQRAEAVPLETAYELDDAPRFERFYFLTSDRPIDVDRVLGEARAGKTTFTGLEVSSIRLEKR